MLRLLKRYRVYLAEKAFPLDGLALANEMKTQAIPWFLLPLIWMSICWLFSVSDAVEKWGMRLTLCMSTAGFTLVAREFFLSPLRNDIITAWNRRDRT